MTCSLSITTSSGPISGPASACTREGVDSASATWVGGNSPYLPTRQAPPTGYCRGDSDCASGTVCSFADGPLAEQFDCTCDPTDGSDSCNPLGQ